MLRSAPAYLQLSTTSCDSFWFCAVVGKHQVPDDHGRLSDLYPFLLRSCSNLQIFKVSGWAFAGASSLVVLLNLSQVQRVLSARWFVKEG
jgi:hypothetical protein